MANLFAGQPKVIPEFTGLQVNTAVQVLPIPIIYGSPRVNLNMIYYNGFNVQQVNQGGKGILSGGKGSQTTEYFATLILALGEGPLGNPLIIYQDQEVWTPATYPSNGAYYYNGTATQTPWPYIATTWPNDARGYKDTAYYGFSNAQLDSSATVPQLNVVVSGIYAGTSPLNNSNITITSGQYDQSGNPLSFIGTIPLGDADADPGMCIYDFLTNATYGATFPSYWIDTTTLLTSAAGFDPNSGDTALSTFCQAVGLAWSTVINNVESANSILERWAKNLNVAIVWNGAKLRFIPYWDEYASGNPGWDATNGIAKKYFTPYVTPIVTITMDQIIQSSDKGDDPISFARKDPLEVYNTVRLDFRDRTNFFNNVPAEAKDEVHIELNGPRVDNIGLGDEYTLATYANISVQMQLRRNISIMRTFNWKMSPLWGWLDPMDVVAIPDPANYSNTIVVRITGVNDDEDENVDVTAEEFPIGDQSPTTIPLSQTTAPNQGATNVPPSSIYPPIVFAPPTGMLTAQGYSLPQLIFGCSAGYDGNLDTNWGGVNVWFSTDDVNYEMFGTLNNPSVIGAQSQPLPTGGTALYVNMSESGKALPSVSVGLASSGYSICVLQDVSGFEILSYTTATLVAANIYSLTGLYRGLYGTTQRFFGAGSRFMYVGSMGNFLEGNLPTAFIGKTVWVKGQSFNVFRSATQDLSDCVAYPYLVTSSTPAGPLPPPMVSPGYRKIKSSANNVPVNKRGLHK